MPDPVSVEKHSSAVVIRFDRPEIRNPLSVDVLTAIERILSDAESDADIEKVVFTGTGKAFASGADLREIDKLTPETAKDFARLGQRLMAQIANFRLRTIAAVNGACYGGGLDLAIACSERIASPAATFCHPGTGLGIITGWGGTQRLPRLVGRANALEMFFTALPLSATRALEIGLIDSIADDPLQAAL